MDDNTILKVKAHTASQGETLAITADPSQVDRSMEVLHVEHFLMDDRSSIQFPGSVVTGCSNQLHSAVVGALVGIRTRKGRKERMMNIDDTVVVLQAIPVGKDLHVAAEDGQLSRDFTDCVAHPAEGQFLRGFLSRNGDMEEGDPLLVDDSLQVLMIGDDQGDLDIQLSGAPSPEKVGQAVILLADKKDGLNRLRGLPERPTGIQFPGDRSERITDLLEGGLPFDFKGKAGKKPIVDLVGELVDLGKAPSHRGNEVRDPCKKTDSIGAIEDHQERVHDFDEGKNRGPEDS